MVLYSFSLFFCLKNLELSLITRAKQQSGACAPFNLFLCRDAARSLDPDFAGHLPVSILFFEKAPRRDTCRPVNRMSVVTLPASHNPISRLPRRELPGTMARALTGLPTVMLVIAIAEIRATRCDISITTFHVGIPAATSREPTVHRGTAVDSWLPVDIIRTSCNAVSYP